MVDPEELGDRDLIESIDEDGEGLTRWEVGFVSRLMDAVVVVGDTLSEKQRGKAEQIYRDRVPS